MIKSKLIAVEWPPSGHYQRRGRRIAAMNLLALSLCVVISRRTGLCVWPGQPIGELIRIIFTRVDSCSRVIKAIFGTLSVRLWFPIGLLRMNYAINSLIWGKFGEKLGGNCELSWKD